MALVYGKCLLGQLLKVKGLTQADLSYLTGINQRQLNDYIHNRKHMSLITAKIIANAINVYVDDLYEFVVID